MENANVLVKTTLRKISQMLVYETRESGRKIIPGMHTWAQLGVYGGGLGPPTSLRELIGLLLAYVGCLLAYVGFWGY